jgi:hypothetical protein
VIIFIAGVAGYLAGRRVRDETGDVEVVLSTT